MILLFEQKLFFFFLLLVSAQYSTLECVVSWKEWKEKHL